MSRKIFELLWAEELSKKPTCIPTQRRSQMKAVNRAGLVFEDKVAKLVKPWKRNPWFRFADLNGEGFASPDILVKAAVPGEPDHLIVLETKLSFTWEGISQLTDLYGPILNRAFGMTQRPVLVCKNLRPNTAPLRIFTKLTEAAEAARPGQPTIWHLPVPTAADTI